MGNITQLHMIGVPNKLELEEHPYISTVEEPHVCSIKLPFYGSTPFQTHSHGTPTCDLK